MLKFFALRQWRNNALLGRTISKDSRDPSEQLLVTPADDEDSYILVVDETPVDNACNGYQAETSSSLTDEEPRKVSGL